MNNISVVISAWNEEAKIERTLMSVLWAKEIIVVDNESTDKTVHIAKKYTKKIFRRPNHLMLNINKNFGFTKAAGDWILYLDADEIVTPELAEEIRVRTHPPAGGSELNDHNSITGFWIPRKNIIFGKWIEHGLWWPDKQLRLFRRGKGTFPCKHIHEYIKIEGNAGQLEQPYVHYNYESIHQYLTKIDRASTSEALNLKEKNYHIVWHDAIRFPLSDFLKIYFAQQAYKDGLHGLMLSMLQAFYSFCTFAKVWEKTGFPEVPVSAKEFNSEKYNASKQLNYWAVTGKVDSTDNPIMKIWLRIRRKYVSLL